MAQDGRTRPGPYLDPHQPIGIYSRALRHCGRLQPARPRPPTLDTVAGLGLALRVPPGPILPLSRRVSATQIPEMGTENSFSPVSPPVRPGVLRCHLTARYCWRTLAGAVESESCRPSGGLAFRCLVSATRCPKTGGFADPFQGHLHWTQAGRQRSIKPSVNQIP